MKITINGTEYHIDEFQDGFAWVSAADEGQSFPTALEALQSVIDHEQALATDKARSESYEAYLDAKSEQRYFREVEQSFNNRDYQ